MHDGIAGRNTTPCSIPDVFSRRSSAPSAVREAQGRVPINIALTTRDQKQSRFAGAGPAAPRSDRHLAQRPSRDPSAGFRRTTLDIMPACSCVTEVISPHRTQIKSTGKDDDGLYRVARVSFAMQSDPRNFFHFRRPLLHSNAPAVCWID